MTGPATATAGDDQAHRHRSVDYAGRLTGALRLIMLKADGSVLVHADAGGSSR
jgi:hypothetical protein